MAIINQIQKGSTTYDIEPYNTATISASDIPDLPASKITSGSFADSRISSAATWNAKNSIHVLSGVVDPADTATKTYSNSIFASFSDVVSITTNTTLSSVVKALQVVDKGTTTSRTLVTEDIDTVRFKIGDIVVVGEDNTYPARYVEKVTRSGSGVLQYKYTFYFRKLDKQIYKHTIEFYCQYYSSSTYYSYKWLRFAIYDSNCFAYTTVEDICDYVLKTRVTIGNVYDACITSGTWYSYSNYSGTYDTTFGAINSIALYYDYNSNYHSITMGVRGVFYEHYGNNNSWWGDTYCEWGDSRASGGEYTYALSDTVEAI